MATLTLLSNDYADVLYFEEYKLGQITWKRLVTPSEIYRNTLIYLLDYAENHKIISYLSDGRQTGPVDPSDRKWFQDYAIHRAEQIGLKHAAVVIKNDPFRKFYLNSIMKIVNLTASYNMKIFTDYDEAFKWLISFNDYHD